MTLHRKTAFLAVALCLVVLGACASQMPTRQPASEVDRDGDPVLVASLEPVALSGSETDRVSAGSGDLDRAILFASSDNRTPYPAGDFLVAMASPSASAAPTSSSGGSSDGEAAGSGGKSADDIARELSNPVGSLCSLNNKFDYRLYDGDLPDAGDQDSFTYTFQPVFPFPLENGNILFVRATIPFPLSQPVFDAKDMDFDSESGLGDIALDLIYGGTEKSGLLWGVALSQVFPTASNDLGRDQWLAGPEALIGIMGKWGVVGGLISHVWDIAGEDDYDTSLTTANLFYWFGLGDGWQIGGSPILTYDWEADSDNAWTIPIGIGLAKTVKIGDMPLKIALEYQYSLVRPDNFGTEHLISLKLTPVIKNFFTE